MDAYFETFANKICEFCMKKFVLPWMRQHGVIQTYRAEIKSVDETAKTMVVERPFDEPATVRYAVSASHLTEGDNCVVFALGETSNSVVVADGMLNMLGGGGSCDHPRTARMNFSAWDSGTFTETLDSGITERYTVAFDAQGRPISITDSTGHVTEVVW